MNILENIKISEYTTINLGGRAKYFCVCYNEDDVKKCLTLAQEKKLPVKIIAGGSNVIFSDKGYGGLILKLEGEKIKVIEDNTESQHILVWAGTNWDNFVKWSIDNNLSGIECLSCIPGSCGATPIQNVGAYGQEVSSAIKKVIALDIENFSYVEFNNSDCEFGYRTSIFKKKYKNKLIILNILFELSKNKIDKYLYPDLQNKINKCHEFEKFDRKKKLAFIREIVYKIRKSKSMIYDKSDPDSISCGSFFLNPVLNEGEFKNFMNLAKSKNLDPPCFKIDSGYKISAAYLIENSEFQKGFIKEGAGISKKHSLALVNYGCDTKSLLNLAKAIQDSVRNNFGITLEFEPDIIGDS